MLKKIPKYNIQKKITKNNHVITRVFKICNKPIFYVYKKKIISEIFYHLSADISTTHYILKLLIL